MKVRKVFKSHPLKKRNETNFSIFYEEEKIRKEKLIHDPPYRADSTTLTDAVIFLMATSITVKGAKS